MFLGLEVNNIRSILSNKVVMGQFYSAYIAHPEEMPDRANDPTFDPLYGFPGGRKEREMVATLEEMQAMNVEEDKRDYCAHRWIELLKCRSDNIPFFAKCAHEKHVWETCQYEDFILRMKEHERERRLKARAIRQQRKLEKESSELITA